MANNIEIRQVLAPEGPQLLQFLREVYSKDERKAELKFWRWQFLENPALLPSEVPIWALCQEGKIVGQIACIVAHLKMGPVTRRTVWILDFIVHSSLRGGGWGKKLVLAVGRQFPTMLTLGINDDSERVFTKLGWRSLGRIHRYYKILYAGNSRKKAIPSPLRTLLNAASSPMRLTGSWKAPLCQQELRILDTFSDEFNQFWDRARQQWPCCIERSSSWLAWQFSAQPGKRFKILASYCSGRLCGYLVLFFRMTSGSRAPYKISVSDITYDSEDPTATLDLLLHGALSLASTYKAGGVVIDIHDQLAESRLKLFGFSRVKGGPKFMAFSKDCQDLLFDPDNWFVTRADADVSIIEEPNS
jgi:hypothetical protein